MDEIIKNIQSQKIKDYNQEELYAYLDKVFNGIAKDLGITNISDYDKKRFMRILRDHYPGFTISDIKLAFEYAEIGYLDNYLPKDRDGNPQKEHFNKFNLRFYGKILRAYGQLRKKRIIEEGKLNRAGRKQLPQKSKKVDLQFINKEFHNYKESGEVFFVLPTRVAEELNLDYEVTQEDHKKAVEPKGDDNVRFATGRNIYKILGKNISNQETRAQREAAKRAIKRYFDECIEKDMEPVKLI